MIDSRVELVEEVVVEMKTNASHETGPQTAIVGAGTDLHLNGGAGVMNVTDTAGTVEPEEKTNVIGEGGMNVVIGNLRAGQGMTPGKGAGIEVIEVEPVAKHPDKSSVRML